MDRTNIPSASIRGPDRKTDKLKRNKTRDPKQDRIKSRKAFIHRNNYPKSSSSVHNYFLVALVLLTLVAAGFAGSASFNACSAAARVFAVLRTVFAFVAEGFAPAFPEGPASGSSSSASGVFSLSPGVFAPPRLAGSVAGTFFAGTTLALLVVALDVVAGGTFLGIEEVVVVVAFRVVVRVRGATTGFSSSTTGVEVSTVSSSLSSSSSLIVSILLRALLRTREPVAFLDGDKESNGSSSSISTSTILAPALRRVVGVLEGGFSSEAGVLDVDRGLRRDRVGAAAGAGGSSIAGGSGTLRVRRAAGLLASSEDVLLELPPDRVRSLTCSA